jgi:type I restriction enzyme M protein
VEEIANKGYSLVPSKFIEFANRDETVDYETRMKQLQTELSDILKQEANSRKDLMDVFKTLGYELDV